MGYSKIIYGGKTLIDLTGDNVTPDKLLKGATTHDKSGEVIEGTCDFDVNSQDANVSEAEVLFGKTFYARGEKRTGTMKNNGAVNLPIKTVDGEVSVGIGFHDGSGKAYIDPTEQNKIIPENIREGVTILGVEGNMSGSEGMKPQAKTVTPSTQAQEILPDSEYNCLSQVTVNPIPYQESDNAAGGTTVTIG